MIDENFVQAAIKIRRQYLKLTNNMDLYKRKSLEVVNNLDRISKDISEKQENIKNRKLNQQESLNAITEILNNIEEECRNLDDSIKPLNDEMEKLLIEEGELWRQIKEKHYNINEDEIVEYVKNRLLQENLS
jgi:predicted  nucleic acid-binding Zn-ribbon protein